MRDLYSRIGMHDYGMEVHFRVPNSCIRISEVRSPTLIEADQVLMFLKRDAFLHLNCWLFDTVSLSSQWEGLYQDMAQGTHDTVVFRP